MVNRSLEIPFEFATSGIRFQKLDWEWLPFNPSIPQTLDITGTWDDEGVSVKEIDGRYYDHPVRQSWFMMGVLNGFVRTQDEAYLDIAVRHAERMMSRAAVSRNAAYLPYEFEWHLHRFQNDAMEVPWYSGMAQGNALSAFSRMFTVTGDERYLEFASLLFESYFNLRDSSVPWTVEVDDRGLLWFEEYARNNGPSDRAFNGHIYGVYGLHDYWLATGDGRAELLGDGGMTAILGYMDLFRAPGARSFYCITHREQRHSYHRMHIDQFLKLYAFTADPVFAKLADTFYDDYPTLQEGNLPVIMREGAQTVIQADGLDPKSREKVEIPKATQFTLNLRSRLVGEEGMWLRGEDGWMRRKWVRESPDTAYILGLTEIMPWAHPRRVRFAQSGVHALKLDEQGTILETVALDVVQNDEGLVDRRATIFGEIYYRLSSLPGEGYWFRRAETLDIE